MTGRLQFSPKTIHFIHLKRDFLHFVSVIHTTDKPNIDLMTILAFLEQFYHLLQKYFEIEVLTKNVILDNILLVLELIDECIDFGIVQVTINLHQGLHSCEGQCTKSYSRQ